MLTLTIRNKANNFFRFLRYGALAGFGLSLAKWTLIVKHSTDFASGSDNTWLWWLFTAFGMIVCMSWENDLKNVLGDPGFLGSIIVGLSLNTLQ